MVAYEINDWCSSAAIHRWTKLHDIMAVLSVHRANSTPSLSSTHAESCHLLTTGLKERELTMDKIPMDTL
jgi:hypothetical protein